MHTSSMGPCLKVRSRGMLLVLKKCLVDILFIHPLGLDPARAPVSRLTAAAGSLGSAG